MNIPFHFAPAYKFCPAATLPLIVRGGRLWFTRADAFNDAFELSPFLMPQDWAELVILRETQPEVFGNLVNKAFQQVCSSLYITCFSKNYLSPSSQLMWAHYADNHRGVCFCIDFSLIEKDGNGHGRYPVAVKYAASLFEERSKYSPGSPELGMLIGATKSKVWSYEEEVRLLVETNSFDPSKFQFIKDKKNISVVFNPECISKVIFGLKSSEEDVKCVAESFCDIGHAPDFTRLDLDPLTLQIVERDLGITKTILAHRKKDLVLDATLLDDCGEY